MQRFEARRRILSWDEALFAAGDPGRRVPLWRRAHRRGLWRRDVLLESLSVAAFHLGRLWSGVTE